MRSLLMLLFVIMTFSDLPAVADDLPLPKIAPIDEPAVLPLNALATK